MFVANFRMRGGAEGRTLATPRTVIATTLMAFALLLTGCATLPPGMDVPKSASTALANPETTTLGKNADALAKGHPGLSGFDLVVDGAASFAWHQEIAARAERTLDVQYFLFRQDETGKLLLELLLEAADRGVRVRILIDDAEAFDKGSMIRPLAAHPNIEIRIFNPFVVRRELSFFRWAEFLVASRRLNYRMHNKLFIGDNAIALTGGRNVGDSYFQASTVVNLGDFDLAVAGPMVGALSQSFDLYWNDRLAIPVDALPLGKPSAADLEACRRALAAHKEKMAASNYIARFRRGIDLRNSCPASGRSCGRRRRWPTTRRTRRRSNGMASREGSCGSAWSQRSKAHSASSSSSRRISCRATRKWR